MFCIFIYLYYRSIFFQMLYQVYIYAIGVERVHVGRVANLCVTRSGMMYLTWTCEMRGSWIIHRILDNLRIVTVACYLVFVLCVFRSWFWQCSPVVLWYTDIRQVIREQWGYATEIMNERYTRPTPNNMRQSLFLGGFMTYPSWECFNLTLIFFDIMH
jgi:hypothetical protein